MSVAISEREDLQRGAIKGRGMGFPENKCITSQQTHERTRLLGYNRSYNGSGDKSAKKERNVRRRGYNVCPRRELAS